MLKSTTPSTIYEFLFLIACAILGQVSGNISGGANKLIQVYENQQYVTDKWTGTTHLDRIQPPNGYEWSSEWKIDVTNKESGWEYVDQQRRRRRWLRSIQEIEQKKEVSAAKLRASVLRKIKNQYNWKGLSWGVYKSLIWMYSGGIVCRVPLVMNFDFYERR